MLTRGLPGHGVLNTEWPDDTCEWYHGRYQDVHESRWYPRLPAAGPPGGKVWALLAESGVRAVAGVDQGVVRQAVEQTRRHPVEQRTKCVGIAPGVPDPTGEQGIPAEDMGGSVGVAVNQGQGARGMADQVDGLQGYLAHRHPVAGQVEDSFRPGRR